MLSIKLGELYWSLNVPKKGLTNKILNTIIIEECEISKGGHEHETGKYSFR